MKNLFFCLSKDIEVNGRHIEKLLIIIIYRLGNYIYYCNCSKIFRKLLLLFMQILRKIICVVIFKVEIPFKCKIGMGFKLMHPNSIVINENVIIGEYCTIYHQVTIGANEQKNPQNVAKIWNNVYIGCGAKIIGDVIIDDDVRIGANAVVIKDLKRGDIAYCKQYVSSKS